MKRLWLALVLILLFAPPARADGLFGTPEPPAFGLRETYGADLHVFFKWEEVLSRMDADYKAPRPFTAHAELARLDFLRQIAAINDFVNSYPDVSDDDNWGQSDYWETPNEFFAYGGDCEDYAIAKYAWLRYLGMPESRLRIAMVYDRLKETEHMILVVYDDDRHPLYLDNQIKTIRNRNDFDRYWPLYSVNRQGWWIVEPQGKGKQIVQSLLAAAAASAH